MSLIKVNPNVEASGGGFEVVKPGIYQMRIEGATNFPAVQEFTAQSGNTCLKVRLVFVPGQIITNLKGDEAKNPGSVVDSSLVIAPEEKQGKLRSMVEAAGIAWGDFDFNDLVGRELNVSLKVEEYKGNQKNSVDRYIKVGA